MSNDPEVNRLRTLLKSHETVSNPHTTTTEMLEAVFDALVVDIPVYEQRMKHDLRIKEHVDRAWAIVIDMSEKGFNDMMADPEGQTFVRKLHYAKTMLETFEQFLQTVERAKNAHKLPYPPWLAERIAKEGARRRGRPS
jgi:hypothetical protein